MGTRRRWLWPLLLLGVGLPLGALQASESCADRCKTLGECVARKGGHCVAAFDEDCAASDACLEGGRCVARAGLCVALTDASCEASEGCAEAGACIARDGQCLVASDAACQQSAACAREGLCALDDGICVVGSAHDCEASERCRSEGACGLRGGACAPTLADHCAGSEACARDGICELLDGSCALPSATDTGVEAEEVAADAPIQLDGPLRRNAVRKILREVRTEALECGPLTAAVELTAAGKPEGIAVLGVPRRQEKCIAKALKKRTFPERKRATTLTWRLHRPD